MQPKGPKVISLADVKKSEPSDGKPTRNGKELPKPKRNFAHPQGKVVTTNKTQALPLFVDRLRRKHLNGERLTKEQYKLLTEAGAIMPRRTSNQRDSGTKALLTKSSKSRRVIHPPSTKRKRKRALQITFPPRPATPPKAPVVDMVDKLSSGLSTTR